MPLPLAGLHHIARRTKRLEASRAFYRNVLGFREIPRPPFSFGGAWLFNHGVQIHLIVDDTLEDTQPTIQTRQEHVAFATTDIAAVESTLREQGIPFRANLQAGTGVRQLFFQDPDGHHLEVGCYGPTVES